MKIFEEKEGKENLINKKISYLYIAETDKECDLLHDRPVLSSGKMPHDI